MINEGNALAKHTLRLFLLIPTTFLALHNAFAQSKNKIAPAQYAICCVPIADVLGGPVSAEQFDWYEQPICADNICGACKRIDQLLFNEMVEVVGVCDDGKQVHIKLPGKMYETHQARTPRTDGWVARKNLLFVRDLKADRSDAKHLPPPLTLDKQDRAHQLQHTITLKEPCPMPGTGTYFSVGTRFVIKQQIKNGYEVWWLNPNKENTLDVLRIPTHYCLTYNASLTTDQRRHLMIDLARNMIQRSGEVAYVWGGCSMIAPCYDKIEYPIKKTGNLIFDRAQDSLPRNGIDCSGLICRTALMAGIYMPYKNSITMARNLREIHRVQDIKVGDVIWIPGHVMLVSSLEKNLLIEARHYLHGYGRVHEIPLAEEFAGIKTYADLIQAINQKKPIMRKDRHGNHVQKLHDIKILSLTA